MTDPRIDWTKYPRLAKVYQDRPDHSPQCFDLRVILDTSDDVPAMLDLLERCGERA